MNTLHTPVNICAQIGHTYTGLTLVRCLHTGQVTVRVAGWLDVADEDTALVVEQVLEFGPFDTKDEIALSVLELVQDALALQFAD